MLNLLKKINSGIGQLEKWLISWSTILLAVLTVGNVISRKIFNHSWSFTEEISQFILVLITFVSVSYGTRKARHISMTALFEALSRRWQKIFIFVSSAMTAAILFYLAFYAYEYVVSTYQMHKTTPVLRIPFYLVIVCVPVGLALGGIQYLLTLVKNITEKEVWLSFEEKSEYKDIEDATPDDSNDKEAPCSL